MTKAEIVNTIVLETAIIMPAHNIPAFKPAKEFIKEVSKMNM